MLDKLIQVANSWQSETAIIFGMVLQFFLSPVKNVTIFITILMSSVFIAIYLISPFMDIMEITNKSIRESALAFSSLLSMSLLSIIINIAPKGFASILRRKLGINDGTD